MKTKGRARQFTVIIAAAVLFFAVSMPFREFFRVADVTEVRPAGALNPLFGLLYGFPGAFGCAVGNLAADVMSGYTPTICFLGFFVQMFYGLFPYYMWKRSGCEVRLNTAGNVFRFFVLMLLDTGFTALLLSMVLFAMEMERVISMTTLMFFFNDFVFCMVIGIPILLIHTRRKVKKSRGRFSLNEQFILLFLFLAVLSASMIGFIAHRELSRHIADSLILWNKIYIYISVDLLIFSVVSVCFLRYGEKYITVPLEKLAVTARDYIQTEGDRGLDTRGIVGRCEEFADIPGEAGVLAEAFKDMALNLEEYIDNLTKITAEKERIGAELDVATRIQRAMLPCTFPPFPDRCEFDIYATMTPAKEVGGDFYDFFLVDQDHLAMVMADVSGKGIPAALFMMTAKTLLKSEAQAGRSPKDILERVNNQLCENNEAEMFVTVWLGILQISTGRMTCANAGHEYPAIKRKGGLFELFKDKHGFVLAGMEDVRYREYEIELENGDFIFVYTDGVAEATNLARKLYGTERMITALNRRQGAGCAELLGLVHRDVDAFVGEAPQFDDITMLCLEYRGIAEDRI